MSLRDGMGDVLRISVLTLLIAALAGPLLNSRSVGTDIVFLVDTSDSIAPSAIGRALDFVNRAKAQGEGNVRTALVAFGADAAMERSLTLENTEVSSLDSSVSTSATDIGLGLELALGAFEGSATRRIVLFSDGQENLGDLGSAVAMAKSMGVEVSVVPLPTRALNDNVRMQGLVLPADVRAREPFSIRVHVDSADDDNVELLLTRNGSIFQELNVPLVEGRNTITLVDAVDDDGLFEYEAILNHPEDGVRQNNRYAGFVRVHGEPRVLYVGGETETFAQALTVQGLSVERTPVNALPSAMHQLVDFDLVVLDNVSGFDLSVQTMEVLERYVRDTGGGLLMLGGDASYGAGGYYGTPIERVLPVDMDVRTEVKIPSLAVIILLDKSGSMASSSSGQDKLTIAKRAAMATVEVLNPLDRVGVLAFDAAYEWIVPPTEVGNRRGIADQLRLLEAGGGTDLFIGLAEANRLMAEQPARVKHLIVLSDGLSEGKADFAGLLARMNEEKITVSTVAFGYDADRELLESIAKAGQGRHYYTSDINNVPRIFTSETMVVARSLVVEAEVLPVMTYPGEVLEGISPRELPPLEGYQRTFAKSSAQVLLSTESGDPLLSAWRFGLGRASAFASDVDGRWSTQWLQWSKLPQLAGQLARWTMRRPGAELLTARFERRGNKARIILDALDANDEFINGLALAANLRAPGQEQLNFALQQSAPGRYLGEFELTGAGRYYLNVTSSNDDGIAPATFGYAIPYSPEFASLSTDVDALRTIATRTGGDVLAMQPDELEKLLAPKEQAHPVGERVGWPLVLAALILLVLEVLVRRVPSPDWLRMWLAERFGKRSSKPEVEPAYEALLASIEKSRRAHLTRLGEGAYYRPDDPASRARLYIGRASNT